MTDRPIIFSAPMVRALLAGSKTQSRRLAVQWRKTAPDNTSYDKYSIDSPWCRVQVGDRLWVRESFAEAFVPRGAAYMADHSGDPRGLGWRPSIHMARFASRLTLTVTAVRRQRLQEISEEDARAEGIARFRNGDTIMYGIAGPDGYALAGLCARETYTWNDNPEVVALTFTVAQRNIDAPITGARVA